MRRWLAILLLFGGCAGQQTIASERIVTTPLLPSPTPSPAPTPAPMPAPTLRIVTPATPSPVPVPLSSSLDAFRALGSWIDVFDHTDDPNTVVPLIKQMASRGVRTLYLESARTSSVTDIQFPDALGAALDEAKSQGMRVIGWYPPAFDDMERDLRRSLAAISFVSPRGNRFDGFGADIEYTQGVPDHAERSRLAVDYSARLRSAAGAGYPLAAIVIPPTSLDYNPKRWPAFPWSDLSPHYDLFMPMNYWTARGKDADTAATLTRTNAAEVKRLTGRPVHVIGGLGEAADESQVMAYVVAARESGSLGGGLYDFTTTRTEVWDELQALN